MGTFRDLKVWAKAMQLVTKVYNISKGFPNEEVYRLTSQIKRSAISIPSNIAEGYGRNGKKDYLKFLNMSISSLFELQTQIEIAFNLSFIDKKNLNRFMKIQEK